MKRTKMYQIIASLALLTGFSAKALADRFDGPPRGMDVEPLAGNCNIAKFPQVSKAGPYNALCNVMADSEKCLALIKGSFYFNGEEVSVSPVLGEEQKAKGRYCLDVLNRDLGLQIQE